MSTGLEGSLGAERSDRERVALEVVDHGLDIGEGERPALHPLHYVLANREQADGLPSSPRRIRRVRISRRPAGRRDTPATWPRDTSMLWPTAIGLRSTPGTPTRYSSRGSLDRSVTAGRRPPRVRSLLRR
jgi:hypothetical protein